MPGFVYLVGAGPGDPGLITLRAVECLAHAEVVIADRLVSPEILARHVPATAELIVRPAHRDGLDQDEINRLLVERGLRGQVVVRLKGGDPFVFGRGGEEAEALVAAGVPFAVVPGVTAAVAAPAYAGIPLTHRGLAGAVAFATGHEADDKDTGAVAWSELAHAAATLVLYMSVSRLDAVMARLVAVGRAPSEPVALVERGTTARQRVVTGTIGTIAELARAADVQPPALTIVGPVVDLRQRIGWFEQRRRILLLSTKAAPTTRPEVDLRVVSPLTIVPRFADVKAALGRLDGVRTIAFASGHAVDAVAGALAALGRDARAFAGVQLAAVGAATAEGLLARGLRADVVGDTGGAALAEALIDAGAGAGTNRGPALVFGAADGRPELAQALVAAGWRVDSVAAYDSVPDDAALTAALKEHRARPFDAVAFSSPRGARAFVDLAGTAALAGVRLGAIGDTTAAALRELGLATIVTAATPDLPALIDAVANLE